MKFAYAVLGIGFIILIGVGVYLMPDTPAKTMLTLASPSFSNGGVIPTRYTCDADAVVSPSFTISNVPAAAKMLVLVMNDPDVPKALKPDGEFDHWVLYGIDPKTTVIAEGTPVGMEALNGAGKTGYVGPCPPTNYQPSEHRYVFTLYAVDTTINFFAAPTKEQVLTAINDHIIEKATLTGRYQRPH